MLSTGTVLGLAALAAVAFSAERPSAPVPAPALSVLYPKHQSAVGRRVNVVIDPATDWSAVPFLQVKVGGTEYPVVDTSSGKHAVQGVALAPGLNAVTVRGLAPAGDGPSRAIGRERVSGKYDVVSSQTIAVYNREGSFSPTPPSFENRYYHTRENEAVCSGCHRLDAEEQDRMHGKPEDVLCFACHREIPAGRYIHGPAAVWNCLACHDPDRSPVKYQFAAVDPWQVTKTSAPVEPAVFTVPAASLFRNGTADLLSEERGVKGGKAELRRRKERERGLFREFLSYARQHPADRIRIEVHAGGTPLPKKRGAQGGRFRDLRQLTAAQAKKLERLMAAYGISGKGRIEAAGRVSSLPRQELDSRVEIIVAPADPPARGGGSSSAPAERLRVTATIAYLQGALPARDLKVVERLPAGMQYVKGSAVYRGKVLAPRVSGNELTWTLGNPGGVFREELSYVIRATAGAATTVGPSLRVSYSAGGRTQVRDLGSGMADAPGSSIARTCQRCHGDMLGGVYQHGPAAAGYCTLCHDPHGSDYPAWTRNQSWRLCTTCHAEKRTEVHLVKGFVSDVTHPTRNRPDPSRPGKKLSCVSCHSPHSADTPEILTYGARNKYDLCAVCHPKK